MRANGDASGESPSALELDLESIVPLLELQSDHVISIGE